VVRKGMFSNWSILRNDPIDARPPLGHSYLSGMLASIAPSTWIAQTHNNEIQTAAKSRSGRRGRVDSDSDSTEICFRPRGSEVCGGTESGPREFGMLSGVSIN
jgi:hypothetical protein